MFSLRWPRSRRKTSSSARTSAKLSRPRVRPCVESLEQRALPAAPVLTGLTFQAIAGTNSSVVVATLNAADPGPGGFFAFIGWGDGAVSVGTVTGNSGNFVISATHNYANTGIFKTSIGVDGIGPAPSFSVSANGQANVIIDPIILPVSAGIAAAQNQLINGPVATFQSSITPPPNPTDFTATINWGDGTTTPGAITVDPAGTLTVSGAHRYTVPGAFPLFVTLAPIAGQQPVVAEGIALVSPSSNPFAVQPVAVHAAAGLPFTDATLGTFTSANTAATTFSAQINWGDGTPNSAGVIAPAGSAFSVLGGHIYAAEGTFAVHVRLADALGNVVVFETSAVVGGFLTSLYSDVLSRPPDAPGLSYWNLQLAQGATHAAIALAFQQSAEGETLQVNALYTQLLHRTADPGGLAYWAAQLQAGFPTQAVVLGLMTSPEYFTLHPLSANFVAGAYVDLLSRSASPDEVSRGVSLLSSGVAPAAFLQLVLSSSESYQQAIVGNYVGILRRPPSTAEAQNWLTLIQSGMLSPRVFSADLFGSIEYNVFADRTALT